MNPKYCINCKHSKYHADDMTWCPKQGRVQNNEKPIDCNSHEWRDTDMAEPQKAQQAVMLANPNETADLFGGVPA